MSASSRVGQRWMVVRLFSIATGLRDEEKRKGERREKREERREKREERREKREERREKREERREKL
jgi:hypothetical protein